MTLEERIEKLIEGVNAMQDAEGVNAARCHWQNEGARGAKFARLCVVKRAPEGDDGEYIDCPQYGHSAYCFVALVPGRNRKLGQWEAGDIFKCDGWKGPAKHRRGTVMADDFGLSCCSRYGVAYL